MDDMIVFTRGVPALESLPNKKLQECAVAALEKDGSRVLQYGNAAGYPPLCDWIAKQHNVTPEQILVGQGSLQLLDTLVRVSLQTSDTVFLEQPTYDRSLTIFRRSGAQLNGILLKDGRLDFEELESKLETRGIPKYFYIIPDFQNPSGAVMPLADRKKLIELARKHGFILIEDGPYRQLRYGGEGLPSLFELAPDCVIFMSSFSKLISPGLRVGYMILPTGLVQEVRKFAEDTYINASYFNQAVVQQFINRGWLDQNLLELKELYRPRLNSLLGALDREFQGIAAWVKPEGGFFVGLNLDKEYKVPNKENTRKAGLVLSDSRGFFIEGGEQFIRLPFCALTPQQLEEGIHRLRQAVIS